MQRAGVEMLNFLTVNDSNASFMVQISCGPAITVTIHRTL